MKESKTEGVSILIVVDLPFTLTHIMADNRGRYLFLKCKIGNKSVTLASIYVPNVGQVDALCSPRNLSVRAEIRVNDSWASALCQSVWSLTIYTIRYRSGKVHRTNQNIASQFQSFYHLLYNLPLPPTSESDQVAMIQNFLASHCHTPYCPLPGIPPLSWGDVIGPQTNETGQEPRTVGLKTRYYKTFSNALLPHFLRAFNSDSALTSHSPQLLEAHVTVIPKDDKEPSLVSNYHSLSLLNMEINWYDKALENHLLPLLSSIVSLDQVGFVPGWLAWDNTLKVLYLQNWPTETKTQVFFLSMDA